MKFKFLYFLCVYFLVVLHTDDKLSELLDNWRRYLNWTNQWTLLLTFEKIHLEYVLMSSNTQLQNSVLTLKSY